MDFPKANSRSPFLPYTAIDDPRVVRSGEERASTRSGIVSDSIWPCRPFCAGFAKSELASRHYVPVVSLARRPELTQTALVENARKPARDTHVQRIGPDKGDADGPPSFWIGRAKFLSISSLVKDDHQFIVKSKQHYIGLFKFSLC